MNTQSSQPRAIYYVVALQIWEYFSFFDSFSQTHNTQSFAFQTC